MLPTTEVLPLPKGVSSGDLRRAPSRSTTAAVALPAARSVLRSWVSRKFMAGL